MYPLTELVYRDQSHILVKTTTLKNEPVVKRNKKLVSMHTPKFEENDKVCRALKELIKERKNIK